ncbi:MAG: T9SS type A sorting domain-containing protein [candidate division WOR-3 bacterium]|nr:MAG: T9SS type A sorting domain-containing protein [candidate division WOR-3 bacterium]
MDISSRGYCYALAVAPSGPDTVYAAGYINAAGAAARSIDRGVNWTQTPAPAETVFGLTVHPEDAAHVYAATTGGVYHSTDAGETWNRLLNRRGMRAIELWPGIPQNVFAAGDDGVLVSYDGGTNWEEMNQGLPDRPVHCLEAALLEPFSLYEMRLLAGTEGAAAYAWSFLVGIDGPGNPEHVLHRLTVRPSVSSGRVRLSLPTEAVETRVRVVDATGRVAFETLAGNNSELDLSGLAAGVYLLVPGSESGLEPARFALRR